MSPTEKPSILGARRLVLKIGSALLVDRDSRTLRTKWLNDLCADIAWLRAQDVEIVVVSSGSIALGRGILDLRGDALALEQSQAAAAVGQIALARAYETELAGYGLKAAQILMTLEDTRDRRRYLNARATLSQLLKLGVVPIVNENDTVATDEIRFGDNDRLAAQIAATIEADMLILLSDVDGFYSANPTLDANARHFDVIDVITPEIEAMAGDAASAHSKGGMKTKLIAARTATDAGCHMAICLGTPSRPLQAIENGAKATWFKAAIDTQAARKRWIAAMKTEGSVTVDAGAARALDQGNSLLPAGVIAVNGHFERGAAIAIDGPAGLNLGLGLTAYNSDEISKILGHHTADIAQLLGYSHRSALIHRDDMALRRQAS